MVTVRAVPRDGTLAIFVEGKFKGLLHLTTIGDAYQGNIKLKKVV